MILSNLESVPGHTISKQLDVVYGSTVRSKHVGRDFMAGLKNIVGGELKGYTELLEESRQEAMDRMIQKAKAMGANAVVGIRFSTSNIAQGASELFVYGTAVQVVANSATHQSTSLPDPFPNQG
ncbi:MAG: YbjQ family protein [Acinetobacter sp.]|nr:YbjQ family protein [Acinetobacter sp.]